jgi:hypothetical protein
MHEAIALSPHVMSKIYELSNMFLADRAIAAAALRDTKGRFNGKPTFNVTIIERLRNELFLGAAATLLVEIAIFLRILDDKFEGKCLISDDVSLQCGDLQVGEITSILCLREACNKIIHAKCFDFCKVILEDHRNTEANVDRYFTIGH